MKTAGHTVGETVPKFWTHDLWDEVTANKGPLDDIE